MKSADRRPAASPTIRLCKINRASDDSDSVDNHLVHTISFCRRPSVTLATSHYSRTPLPHWSLSFNNCHCVPFAWV